MDILFPIVVGFGICVCFEQRIQIYDHAYLVEFVYAPEKLHLSRVK